MLLSTFDLVRSVACRTVPGNASPHNRAATRSPGWCYHDARPMRCAEHEHLLPSESDRCGGRLRSPILLMTRNELRSVRLDEGLPSVRPALLALRSPGTSAQ